MILPKVVDVPSRASIRLFALTQALLSYAISLYAQLHGSVDQTPRHHAMSYSTTSSRIPSNSREKYDGAILHVPVVL